MSAPARVEFFFSPGSRYSYLAASRMPRLQAETGCTVEWRPVNGPDIRRLRGADPFAGPPVSGQYEWAYRERDARRWAALYGIPFREPPSREFDFALLARAALAAKRLDRAEPYGIRICTAVYGSDRWPLDEEACVAVARDVGLSEREFSAVLHDPQTRDMLDHTAAEAIERGIFGVPSFVLGDDVFWGNDRIVLLRHALERRAAS